MANPTTNYGWPMPTSTDLVTDLPADFALFGQPVDTSLKALNPETTLGDISFRSSTSNTNTRLGIGTAGQVLAVSGGVPAWTTTADVTPLTTKGDLFTFTTVDARIGVGANNTVLTADSAEASGLKWATTSSGALTLLRRASFSGVTTTTTSYDTLFSATYSAYIIAIETMTFSGTGDLKFNWRKAGSTQSNASYNGNSFGYQHNGSLLTNAFSGQTSAYVSAYGSGSFLVGELYADRVGQSMSTPFLTGEVNQNYNHLALNFGADYNANDNFDGFIFTVTVGTMTGTISVYGLAIA